jgi:hypothetical protein
VILLAAVPVLAGSAVADKPQQPPAYVEPTGALEITSNPQLVLATGNYVRQYDWVDGAFQHTWSGDGITKVVIGDVDNDDTKEIVSGKTITTKVDRKTTISKYYLRIWEDGADTSSPSVDYEIGHQMGTMAIGDVDGDGDKELVISCVDAYGSAEIWSVSSGACTNEATISNLGWSALEIADCDNDGIAEIQMSRGDGDYSQQPVVADYNTGTDKYSILPLPMSTNHGMSDISVGNIDGVSGNEIFASASAYISVWRHTDDGYEQVWDKQLTLTGETLDCFCMNNEIADIDGDGGNEMAFTDYRIIGTTGKNTAVTKLVIYKYDGSNKWSELASYDGAKGNFADRMVSANLDDDDAIELIVQNQVWDWDDSQNIMIKVQELTITDNLMGQNSIA